MPFDPRKFSAAGWAALAAAAALLVLLLELVAFLMMPAGQARSVIVRIYPGTSLANVAQTLQARGLVTSAWKFRWLARLSGKAARIKAGEYDLSPALTPGDILDLLAEGKVRLIQLTVPEGYSMAQVAATLEAAGLGQAERFLALCSSPALAKELGVEGDSLEGYLFPDTYNISFFMTEDTIARMMVKRFLTTWRHYAEEARARGRAMREVVTLASIIEKETGQPQERPLISAVFQNRLRRGMPLQSDPTVIYGITNFNGNLTRRDLETVTPYNTYCVRGLPAGPIANPGEAAIRAVLKPARCNYLYFVARNDGSHKFSSSLEEHNKAVAYYQATRATREATSAAAKAAAASCSPSQH